MPPALSQVSPVAQPTASATRGIPKVSEFALQTFRPLALNYSADSWTVTSVGSAGWVGLGHVKIAACFIRELFGTDAVRELIGTSKFGTISYHVREWPGDVPESYERLYFLAESSTLPVLPYHLAFAVGIPTASSDDCITQAEGVLATLHSVSQ